MGRLHPQNPLFSILSVSPPTKDMLNETFYFHLVSAAPWALVSGCCKIELGSSSIPCHKECQISNDLTAPSNQSLFHLQRSRNLAEKNKTLAQRVKRCKKEREKTSVKNAVIFLPQMRISLKEPRALMSLHKCRNQILLIAYFGSNDWRVLKRTQQDINGIIGRVRQFLPKRKKNAFFSHSFFRPEEIVSSSFFR